MAKTIKKLAALAVALMICVSAMSVGVFALDTPSLTMYDQRCIDADSEFEVNVEAWNFNDVFGAFIVLDLDGLELVSVSKNGTKELTANQDYYVSEGKVRIVALGDKNGDSVTAAFEDGGSALTLKLKMPKEISLKDSYNISFVTDEQEEYYCEFVDSSNADINVTLSGCIVAPHDWTDWWESTPSSAAHDGEEARNCNECGEYEYRNIPCSVTADSLTINKVTLIENYDGGISYNRYDEVTGQDIEPWFQYSYDGLVNYTVTLPGGQVLESDGMGEVEYQGEWFSLDIEDDQSYDNQWGLGTHTATGKIFGKEVTFDVEIVENPVESVTVQDISIIEGTSLETREDRETTPSTEYEVYSYYPEFSVKLKGEDTIQNSWEGPIIVLGREFYGMVYSDDQSKTNKWGIGSHTVKGKFLGVETSFTVTITESPFESIEIKDITLIENFDTSEWNTEWTQYTYQPEFTATLKNNEGTLESEYGWIEYKGQSYSLNVTDDQSAENEWGKGTHTATGKLFGKTDTFNVNIIENPVESVIVDNISIIEGTNLSTAWDEFGEYQYYDFDPHYTIKFNDGTPDATTDGEYIIVAGREISPSYYDEQSSTVVWGVGEHTATAEFLGVEATFTVTITPSPIKSVTAEDFSVIEKTGGSYVQSWVGDSDTPVEWYEYGCDTKVTVELQDGTFKDATNGIQIGGEWYYPSYDSDQAYDNQWGVGTHTATVTLLGKSDEFNVTVTASPVESLVINSVDVIENVDGDIWGEDEEDYFRYWYDPTFTVKLNDGRTFTSSYNYGSQEVEIDGERYWLTFEDTQWEEHWTLGEHKAYATLLGKTVEFTVNVIETPFSSVVFDDVQVTENIDGYEGENFFVYSYTPSFTVNFKDNSKQPLISKDGYVEYNNSRYYVEVEEQTEAWAVGEHQASASVLGVNNDIKVTVVKNVYENLLIEEVDGQLVLTFETDEGEEKMTALGFAVEGMDEDSFGGILYTDGKDFSDVYLYYDATTDISQIFTNNVKIKIGTLESNTLASCKWFRVNIFASDYVGYLTAYRELIEFESFDGSANAENIDALISFAINLCGDAWQDDVEWETIGDYEYVILDADIVKDRVKTIFGIDNLDLSLTPLYDAEAGKVKVLMLLIGGWAEGEMDLAYENGEWTLTFVPAEGADYVKLTIVMDENAAIKSFEFEGLPFIYGDANGDEVIDGRDVNSICRYIANYDYDTETSTETIFEGADANGDGVVDGRDVNIICRYIANFDYDTGSSTVVLGPQK